MTWLGFMVAFVLLLVVARYSLTIGLVLASLVLGLFTLSIGELYVAFRNTLTDPSILLLALSVGMIPIIGGLLEVKGQMDDLIANLRFERRAVLALIPALMGMLPMPGGALLSAPMVDKAGGTMDPVRKTVVNIWFRHTLLMVYPLGPPLIASAKIANLAVYDALPYLVPPFVAMLVVGYFFHLRGDWEGIQHSERFSAKRLLVPLVTILITPALDYTLRKLGLFEVQEVSLVIALSTSLLMAIITTRSGLKDLVAVVIKMKPQKFAGIILGMFIFLAVFKASAMPKALAAIAMPPAVLCLVIGFLLGVATGRIQVPASVVVPIYVAKYEPGLMTAPVFALTFFAIFLGYLISPVHPCLVVTLEHFNITLRSFFRVVAPSMAVVLAVVAVLALIYPW